MGCNGSKSTETENSNSKKDDQPGEKGEDVWITVEEAEGYVQKEMGVNEETAKKVVSKINKNDDGKVSNDELIALWNKVKENKEKIEPMFKDADKEETGKVSVEQAVDILKKHYDGVPEAHLTAMVKRMDRDDSKTINYHEFVLVYSYFKAKKEVITAQFDTLDKDGNGKLVPDDVVKMLMEEAAMEEHMAKSFVEDFEQNKDGAISKEEFNKLMNGFFG